MIWFGGLIFLGILNRFPDLEWMITGWWFQISFMFTPIWGNHPIWRAYFSDGLVQPPPRLLESIQEPTSRQNTSQQKMITHAGEAKEKQAFCEPLDHENLKNSFGWDGSPSQKRWKHRKARWATFKTLYTSWLIGFLRMAYYNPYITG